MTAEPEAKAAHDPRTPEPIPNPVRRAAPGPRVPTNPATYSQQGKPL